jgi:hypothetical protein
MMNLVSGQYAQVATGFDQLYGPTPVPEPGPGGVRVVADLQPHLPSDRGRTIMDQNSNFNLQVVQGDFPT